MKVFIKTSKGNHFEIQVSPEDTIGDVKKHIEDVKGSRVYPAFKQMLIYQGRVLKDDATLKANNVADNSFILIMLTKSKSSVGEGSGSTKSSERSSKSSRSIPTTAARRESVSVVAPVADPVATPSPKLTPASMVNATSEAGVASNQATRSNFEETVQQIVDMGGGAWNRDIVIRALASALNNPELAVEYLYSGIPEQDQIPHISQSPSIEQSATTAGQPFQPSAPPDPLNFLPQEACVGHPNVGSNASGTACLGFLRNSHQFQALQAMVQANPETLQPMLQELGKQNPNLMRLIEEHHDEFLHLVNEPVEGGEGNVMRELAWMMPREIQVTPEERDAIVRLEAMGFDRSLVLEVFFACNKNEELAANYLLDHMDEF